MSTEKRDLVSRAARRQLAGMTLVLGDAVTDFWEDEGFPAATGPAQDDWGNERWYFEHYADGVNWNDPQQVGRALRTFQNLLGALSRRGHLSVGDVDELRALLERDSIKIDDRLAIRWLQPVSLERSLRDLTDASGILAELDRIREALPADPAGVIGAAKQLVEATAKVVLHERGQTIDEHAKLPELIRKAQDALLLHPAQTTVGPDGSEAVKKILGAVQTIVIGLAELRNRGYGTGHGQLRSPGGLGHRHGHLAANAATTWCQLMLDTLKDPQAPWQTRNKP